MRRLPPLLAVAFVAVLLAVTVAAADTSHDGWPKSDGVLDQGPLR
jgi:hypothetical protein